MTKNEAALIIGSLIAGVLFYLTYVQRLIHQRRIRKQIMLEIAAYEKHEAERRTAVGKYHALISAEKIDYEQRLLIAPDITIREQIQNDRSWRARYKHYFAEINETGQGYAHLRNIRGVSPARLIPVLKGIFAVHDAVEVDNPMRSFKGHDPNYSRIKFYYKPDAGAPIEIDRVIIYVIRQWFINLDIEKEYADQARTLQDAEADKITEINYAAHDQLVKVSREAADK